MSLICKRPRDTVPTDQNNHNVTITTINGYSGIYAATLCDKNAAIKIVINFPDLVGDVNDLFRILTDKKLTSYIYISIPSKQCNVLLTGCMILNNPIPHKLHSYIFEVKRNFMFYPQQTSTIDYSFELGIELLKVENKWIMDNIDFHLTSQQVNKLTVMGKNTNN